MNRRLATSGIAAALTAAVLFAPTTAAHADTDGCVTKAEYRKVKKNMPKTRVHAIFDTAGKRESRATSGGYVAEVRSYRVCGSRYSAVAIAFDKEPRDVPRLAAKSAVWVSA
jgi:hypothetical protein